MKIRSDCYAEHGQHYEAVNRRPFRQQQTDLESGGHHPNTDACDGRSRGPDWPRLSNTVGRPREVDRRGPLASYYICRVSKTICRGGLCVLTRMP